MASAQSMQTDLRKLRKHKKLKKRFKRFLIVTAFLALAGVVFLTRGVWLPYLEGIADRAHETIVNEGKLAGGNFPVKFGETSYVTLETQSKSFTILTDTHAITYDSNGERLSSIQHGYTSPVIKTAEKRSVIYDLGGYSFTVVNKLKTVYSKKLDGQILYVNISDDNYIAVVTKTDKQLAFLTIFDNNGSELFHWSCGQRILSVEFNSQSTGCVATTVSAKGGQLVSTVYSLDFSKTEEVFISGPHNAMLIELADCSDSDIWCIGDERMFRMSDSGEIVYWYDYPSVLERYDASSGICCFAFESASRGESTLMLVAGKQNPDPVEIAFDEKIKAVKAVGAVAYVMTQSKVITYNGKGEVLATAEIADEYSELAVIGDEVFLLGYHEINRIEFKT